MMHVIAVAEQSQIAEARRRAAAMAETLGFGPSDIGRASIVATELATNLVRHAGGGDLLVGAFEGAGGAFGLELLALDKGPGMRDVQRCIQDGYSTAGTAGNGLGAILRQSDAEIWSRPGAGTAVVARMLPSPRGFHLASAEAPAPVALACGTVVRPIAGEESCGDDCAVVTHGHVATVLMADGLGHGVLAATASQTAVRLFRKNVGQPLTTLLQALHAGLQSTRGAAVAVARIDLDAGTVTYAGIGNIAGVLVDGGRVQRMVSHNGTCGVSARRIQEFSYSFTGNPLVVMHSDGLGSGWSFDTYPGLVTRSPSLIAGVLYRDFNRARDDASVLVVRGERA